MINIPITVYNYVRTLFLQRKQDNICRIILRTNNVSAVSAQDSLLLYYFDNSEDLSDTHAFLYCAIADYRVAGVKFVEHE